jgi:hypothetical protein
MPQLDELVVECSELEFEPLETVPLSDQDADVEDLLVNV